MLAIIVLVGHSYYQNSDVNLLKFDKIITESESDLKEGFLGTKDKIFLSQEYTKLQDAQREYQNMLNSLEQTISQGETTNMQNHLETSSQVKQHLSDNEYLDDKLFQIKQHRQNNKLNKIESDITEYNRQLEDIGIDNSELKSIKSQAESVNLNIKQIHTDENNSANNKYILFTNEQCLSYDTEKEDKENEDTYKLAFCNRSDPKLHFKINSVGDVEEYNNHVSNSDQITSDYVIGFPFSVVKPSNSSNQCLTLDQEGMSVQPCNLQEAQMWHPSSYTRACKQ